MVSGLADMSSQLTWTELEGALEGILEQIWLSDVQDTSGDYEVRRRGLLVYLHVRHHVTTGLTLDRQSACPSQASTRLLSFRSGYRDPGAIEP